MSDNDDEQEGEIKDPVVEHVDDQLDKGENLTKAHLDEYKKQLDARLDQLSRDKTKDEQEKSELKGQIETLLDEVKELKTKLEEKSTHDSGETLLIAPQELNPKQQNDGIDDIKEDESNQPLGEGKKKRSGWKRYV
jgi:ABC-type phosphate transport system auxiliary subunit